MNEAAQRAHTDIRIRAVPGRGEEGPYLPLTAADKAELGRLAEIIEFKTAGSQIVSRGQPASFLYLLADGIVEADRTLQQWRTTGPLVPIGRVTFSVWRRMAST